MTQQSMTQAREEPRSKGPGLITGALVGAFLTAPLIAVMYLADQLLGLPFVPFDFFDWLTRTLPGDIIRFGINLIVDVIEVLELGETSSAAKTLEHIQAILLVWGIGVVGGAVMFRALTSFGIKSIYPVLTGAGVLVGLAMAIISNDVNFTSTASPAVRFIWIVGIYFFWGAAFAWVYDDMTSIGEAQADEPNVVKLNRRQFLVRLGGTTATLTVVGTGLGLLLERDTNEVSTGTTEIAAVPDDLPNADASVIPVPGTRPEYTPLDDHYRIDISAQPPVINGETYRLRIGGMVEEPLEISLWSLQENYEPVNQFVTLSCISNRIAGDLISTTRWTGVPMRILLDDWGVSENAKYLHITSADGFDEWVSIDLIRKDERVMLTYAWDGQPLKQKHGFPLRIYIPDRYGMKQPKWITDIEAVEEWGEGYWVARRWDREAIVNTVSVVDTVSVSSTFERDGQLLVPVGGIAYSGARSISRVEVSVDDGDWQEARLREPLSETTWVLWRFDWPYEPGNHTFAVRCYDGAGNLQPTERQSTFPSGATGVHEVSVRVRENVTPQPEPTEEADSV
ncbi:MAG: molybdopterin-dependent oxidoreductase [Chloroflexota bacterium]